MENISKNDRMFVYLWENITPDGYNADGICKFGERWVPAGKIADESVSDRIRQSLGVQKYRFDKGLVRIVDFWDVSDIAKKYNKFYKNSRVDDFLRNMIGYRMEGSREQHELTGDEFRIKVNKLLTDLDQPLNDASLSTIQYKVAQEVLEKFESGNKVVVVELCPRFGKTIWAGAVLVELDVDVAIIASYVPTVFSSFAKDLTRYNQFADRVHIDMANKDYKKTIRDALSNDKKIVTYLSLCSGQEREERIKFLMSLKSKKLLVVDEADFGAHKQNQAQLLISNIKKLDHVLIMTGTNADKASNLWKVDYMTSVTYPELLMTKKGISNA